MSPSEQYKVFYGMKNLCNKYCPSYEHYHCECVNCYSRISETSHFSANGWTVKFGKHIFCNTCSKHSRRIKYKLKLGYYLKGYPNSKYFQPIRKENENGSGNIDNSNHTNI
mgnify:CR=1 FL=1